MSDRRGGGQVLFQAARVTAGVVAMLAESPLSKSEISTRLGQKEISGQLNRVVWDMLKEGVIELTIPGKPQSRLQRYRIRLTTDT
ncbi:MAG: Fic family protein [Armatimonadota bacterium]